MHQTIKKVGADIETLKMNTAIAQLMTLVNALYDNGGATRAEFETVVQLLNPFAPHMTEELWEKLGHSHDEQLAYYPWPKYEEAKCVESTVEIAVQVNGKVKARLKVAADINADDAIAAARLTRCCCRSVRQDRGQGDLRQGPSGQSGCQRLNPAFETSSPKSWKTTPRRGGTGGLPSSREDASKQADACCNRRGFSKKLSKKG